MSAGRGGSRTNFQLWILSLNLLKSKNPHVTWGGGSGVMFSIAPSTSMPPLLTVNWIAVNLDCTGWQNLQALSSLLLSVMELFTVSDETYIGTHRIVPVSFITDCKSYATNCKSDNSTCTFCQPLQSLTIAGTAIWLTITKGGGDWNQTQYASGGWLKTEISQAYWWGLIENISPEPTFNFWSWA